MRFRGYAPLQLYVQTTLRIFYDPLGLDLRPCIHISSRKFAYKSPGFVNYVLLLQKIMSKTCTPNNVPMTHRKNQGRI